MSTVAAPEQGAWYLVQTKPRQEFRALEQLQNQGFTCFLPTLQTERIVRGRIAECAEPLFSRYLFVQLNADSNWSVIRSTRGVSKLVAFGGRFATLPYVYVQALQRAQSDACKRLFDPGELVKITQGPFAGLEGIYQLSDGEARALVLIELMNRSQTLKISVERLQKAA